MQGARGGFRDSHFSCPTFCSGLTFTSRCEKFGNKRGRVAREGAAAKSPTVSSATLVFPKALFIRLACARAWRSSPASLHNGEGTSRNALAHQPAVPPTIPPTSLPDHVSRHTPACTPKACAHAHVRALVCAQARAQLLPRQWRTSILSHAKALSRRRVALQRRVVVKHSIWAMNVAKPRRVDGLSVGCAEAFPARSLGSATQPRL